jgi:hypothetical protein
MIARERKSSPNASFPELKRAGIAKAMPFLMKDILQ